jgi:hypothetical protein
MAFNPERDKPFRLLAGAWQAANNKARELGWIVWAIGAFEALYPADKQPDILSVNGIRALNEFFLEVGWRDTLKVSDFTLGDYKWPSNSEERRALITKINKQISHLTDERTLVEQEKIGDQDRTALYELLVADLRNFTGYLRPELRPTRQVFWALRESKATVPVAGAARTRLSR